MITGNFRKIEGLIAKARELASQKVEGDEERALLLADAERAEKYLADGGHEYGIRVEKGDPDEGMEVGIVQYSDGALVQHKLGMALIDDGFGILFAKDNAREQELFEAKGVSKRKRRLR